MEDRRDEQLLDESRVPSPAATERLQRGLAAEVACYRRSLAEDLSLADEARRFGDDDAVVTLLESSIASLSRMQEDVNRIVAEAVVEREAEAVQQQVRRDADADASPPARSTGGVSRAAAVSGVAASLAAIRSAREQHEADPILQAFLAEGEALAAESATPEGEGRTAR